MTETAREAEIGGAARSKILAAGTVIAGRYTVDKHLAAGGMGRVYVATQAPLGRKVALKVMHHDLCQDRESVHRFMNEAIAVSQLTHPNTITVFDYGESADGNFFIAMEFLEGEPLGDRLARSKKMDPDTALNIVIQVARSLSEAHRKGIIHRDLKPDNVFLGNVEKDLVKVLDFGIAKMLLQENEEAEKLTRMGFVCGTPEYMSPEQARGEDLDGRSDLYALGVMLYEMLTGNPPFMETTPLATVLKHQNEPVPPLPSSVPKSLASFIIDRALAKEREDRPGSAEEFIEELELAAVQSGYMMDTTGSVHANDLRRALAQASSDAPAIEVVDEFPDVMSTDGESLSSPTSPGFAGPARKRSLLVPILAVACVIAVLGVVAIAVMKGAETSEDAQAATATSTQAEADEAPPVDTAPEAAPLAPADPVDDAPGAAAPVVYEHHLTTALPAVTVYTEGGRADGKVLGIIGPDKSLAIDFAAGQAERSFVLNSPGYFDKTVRVVRRTDVESGARVDDEVTLEPLPRVQVTSEPEGATVFAVPLEGGDVVELGSTPLELPFEPGARVALRLELDGYKNVELDKTLEVDADDLHSVLKKERRRGSDRKTPRDNTARANDSVSDTGDKTNDGKKDDGKKDDGKKGGYKPFN